MALTTIEPGTLLSGKYVVGAELGRGGMAAVYEATNRDIGKRVAIKLLLGELATAGGFTERLLREARAVSAIRSPHICDVYDAGRTDRGVPYLVMELLQGEALFERMLRQPQMSPELTLGIALQICRGLAKAHEADIVHRDLKPENIFVTHDDDGRLLIKILDFGLAKFYAPLEPGKGPDPRLTREGAVFGTPSYMSPEQVRAKGEVDCRTDLWAVACLVYECLTGEAVFPTDEGLGVTFAAISSGKLPKPRRLRPDLPEGFELWFRRALAPKASDRYQTAEALASGLVQAFGVDAPAGALDSSIIQQLLDAAPDAAAASAAGAQGPNGAAPLQGTERVSLRLSNGGASRPRLVLARGKPPRSGLGTMLAVGTAVVLALGAGGYGLWRWGRATRPSPLGSPSAVTSSSAVRLVPSGSAAAGTDPRVRVGTTSATAAPESPYPDKEWLKDVTKAQQLLADGKQAEALTLLRGAFDASRHPMVRNLMEQVQVAQLAQSAGAVCQVTGYARPRLADLLDTQAKPSQPGPPAIAWAPDGAIATWTEARDGGQRAMAAALDEALRNRRLPVEITPETGAVRTPQLFPTPERIAAAYTDAAGPNAGTYLRWLDRDGVIAAAPIVVASDAKARYSGSATRTADGGVLVVWAQTAEGGIPELFMRSYDAELSPRTDPVHLTAYARKPTVRRAIRSVAAGVSSGRAHVAYGFAQEPLTQVRSQAVASSTPAPGAEPGKGPVASATDKTLGTERTLSPKTARAIDPAIACGTGGCFVTWHALQAGGGVAFVDPASGESRWYRPLGPRSAHPTVAVGSDGEVRLLWAEGGRLLTAKVGPDGIGPSSKIARLASDRQTATLTPGREPGEWYVAWLDFESARAEPYGARLRCR